MEKKPLCRLDENEAACAPLDKSTRRDMTSLTTIRVQITRWTTAIKPSQLQQTTNFVTSFLVFSKKGMISHQNCLPADDSDEISCLICYF